MANIRFAYMLSCAIGEMNNGYRNALVTVYSIGPTRYAEIRHVEWTRSRVTGTIARTWTDGKKNTTRMRHYAGFVPARDVMRDLGYDPDC